MSQLIYAFCHIILLVFLKLFFGFKVNGRKNIPPGGSVIIAANHSSFLDPPVLGTALPRQAYYMARYELFSFPIWGRFLRSVKAFPVHRKGVDYGAIKMGVGYLREGNALILFPEGTRSFTGELLPPLPGIGMIAWQGGAVIVPAYIKGTNKALPPLAKFIKFKKIEVTFGKPFFPEKLVSSDLPRREIYDKISRHIMAEIAKLKLS